MLWIAFNRRCLSITARDAATRLTCEYEALNVISSSARTQHRRCYGSIHHRRVQHQQQQQARANRLHSQVCSCSKDLTCSAQQTVVPDQFTRAAAAIASKSPTSPQDGGGASARQSLWAVKDDLCLTNRVMTIKS